MTAYLKIQNTGTPQTLAVTKFSTHPFPQPSSTLILAPRTLRNAIYLPLELEWLVSDNLAYSPFHVIENVRGKAVAKMTLLKDSEMSTKTKILAHNHEFLRAMTREEIAVVSQFSAKSLHTFTHTKSHKWLLSIHKLLLWKL